MRWMGRSLMGLFLLALTLGLLAMAAGSLRSTLQDRWARQARIRPAEERVFAVSVILAEPGRVVPVIESFGEIRSRRSLDLRAPAAGTIIELSPHFVEGGQVAAGELLLRLDPADAQTALDVTATDRREAEAEQAEAAAAVLLARDELAAARAQADLRRAALERQENLLERGFSTETLVETTALAASAADQAVLGKRQALAQAEARATRAASTLSRIDIRLAEARRRLENTEIFAEFSGVLSATSVVEGGLVGPNEKIGRLIDPAALEVAFRLSNNQFASLVTGSGGIVGAAVTARLDLFGSDISVVGQIERIGAEVGAGQTGRQIFAGLPPEAATTMRPGDFVAVEVSEPAMDGVVRLPASALDAAGNVLVLAEGDRLAELGTEILRRQGNWVIVRGPDIAGREVVETRSPLLGAGIRVKPSRSGAAPAVETPEMIELTPERRARLIAFVEANGSIPDDRKARIIERLNAASVPVEIVNRIEARIGG
ncbi:MAG: HlyD family efflux transporter periplasmic adaptor subunit [Rhodobacteraceae bacterium]|nr:HlyD family efflux transporter periplasmic adaptor subunit [Paracoccaceae bacterium]